MATFGRCAGEHCTAAPLPGLDVCADCYSELDPLSVPEIRECVRDYRSMRAHDSDLLLQAIELATVARQLLVDAMRDREVTSANEARIVACRLVAVCSVVSGREIE